MIAKRGSDFMLGDAGRAAQYAQQVGQLAHAALCRSGYGPLADVQCDFNQGVLVLQGRVPSYYLKQMAQTLVTQLGEISHVDNRLEVP